MNLFCIIYYEVHIHIKTSDTAFYPHIHLLIKPYLNPRSILQVSEDEIDGLHHHLLHLLALALALVCHAGSSQAPHCSTLSQKATSVTTNRFQIKKKRKQLIGRSLISPEEFGIIYQISKKGSAEECSDYRTVAVISHASKIMLNIPQTRL